MTLYYSSYPLAYFNERPVTTTVDTVVIHSIYAREICDTKGCINLLEGHQVASHYIISDEGEPVLLVSEEKRAWHAGASRMPDGRENVNDFSIGIELVTTPEMKYSEAQYRTLGKLIRELHSRWPIRFVVGHDLIAPGRKVDPGHLFDWVRLTHLLEDVAVSVIPTMK